MNDILLFGAGREGELRSIEEGEDVYKTVSKPQPAEVVGERFSYSAEGFIDYNVLVHHSEKGSFLIGVCGEMPSKDDIDRAIMRYRPKPIR